MMLLADDFFSPWLFHEASRASADPWGCSPCPKCARAWCWHGQTVSLLEIPTLLRGLAPWKGAVGNEQEEIYVPCSEHLGRHPT